MAHLGLIFVAAVGALLGSHAQSVNEKSPDLCKFYDHADVLAGRVLTVKGAYGWEIHHKWVLPDGCKDDEEIFVGLTGETADKIHGFLEKTYPGVTFGGGTVWGTFTGVVTVPDDGIPYLRVTDVQIDESKRMTFPKR